MTSSLTFANVGSFAINPTPEQPSESGRGEVGGTAAADETPPAVQEEVEEEHAYEAIREDDYPPSHQHQWRKSPQRQFRGQDLTHIVKTIFLRYWPTVQCCIYLVFFGFMNYLAFIFCLFFFFTRFKNCSIDDILISRSASLLTSSFEPGLFGFAILTVS